MNTTVLYTLGEFIKHLAVTSNATLDRLEQKVVTAAWQLPDDSSERVLLVEYSRLVNYIRQANEYPGKEAQ